MGCDQCSPGFGKTDSGICLPCPDHCSRCATSEVCDECEAGYGVKGSKCVACPLGCEQCQEGKCGKCKRNFVLNVNKTCEVKPWRPGLPDQPEARTGDSKAPLLL